jgi:hypothetical protein
MAFYEQLMRLFRQNRRTMFRRNRWGIIGIGQGIRTKIYDRSVVESRGVHEV